MKVNMNIIVGGTDDILDNILFAARTVRKEIKKRYPDCREAFLPQDKALKKGDLGVENAEPGAIIEALMKARTIKYTETLEFTVEDLRMAGLVNSSFSRRRRELFSEKLGIGYGNGKSLLKKLNGYGITREEFNGAIQSLSDTGNKE